MTPPKKSYLVWAVVAMGVLMVALVAFGIYKLTALNNEVEVARLENEQLQLANDQLKLSNEYEALNSEFANYEQQAIRVQNDTILAKYTAAKAKVEELLAELNSQKIKSQKRISELQKEIDTLRGLLRHYIAQVDSLGRENEALRDENAQMKRNNQQLSSQVAEARRANESLSERMTLAEKLTVTGLSLSPLKKNGKKENNVTKAKQLCVTFTIPQNNSTPVGEKTIFVRIVSPEGTLLGNAGTFPFEGAQVPCTAKKTIEYAGAEIQGVTIYWDINTALTPGGYTVELFADNYRLDSRHFTLRK